MKEFYPTINLLRGVAALMVCVFHFIGYADSRGNLFAVDSILYKIGELGFNGVFVFFVISGFVIPLSLSKSKFTFRQLPIFLSKRFIRIEIPYIASMLLILFMGFLFAQKNGLDFSVNLEQFLLHIVYLIPFSEYEWYNVIYWTLAIEFQFYLVIALLYFFLSSENKLLIVLSLLVFGALNFISTDDRFIIHYSTIFLQGIVLFLLKSEKIPKVIGLLIMAASVVSTAYLHSFELALFCFLTVLAIQFVEINNKLTNRFGDVSYSLYLTHGLIGTNLLYLFGFYLTTVYERIGMVILVLLSSFVFAWLFWKIIENPSKKLSKRLFLFK